MSTLQVSNLHFESTGNNRIHITAGNTVTFVANGVTQITSNSSTVVVGPANNIVANSTVTTIGANNIVANSTITTIYYGNSSSVDYRSVLDPGTRANSSYTLAIADAGLVLFMSNTSATILNVPNNATIAFKIGTRIDFVQYNTGQVTVSNNAGVTLRTPASRTKTALQYSGGSLYKKDTNEWVLFGDLAT